MPCCKVTLTLPQPKKKLLSDWFVVIKNLSKPTVQLTFSALIFRPSVKISTRAPSTCYFTWFQLHHFAKFIYVYIHIYTHIHYIQVKKFYVILRCRSFQWNCFLSTSLHCWRTIQDCYPLGCLTTKHRVFRSYSEYLAVTQEHGPLHRPWGSPEAPFYHLFF